MKEEPLKNPAGTLKLWAPPRLTTPPNFVGFTPFRSLFQMRSRWPESYHPRLLKALNLWWSEDGKSVTLSDFNQVICPMASMG